MSHHAYKHKLLERLRDLGLRIDSIETALEAPHSKDWDEMAIEREGEEVLEKLGASSQAEVARIRNALRRMVQGAYGTCMKCGEEISEARLQAVPEAALCRNCAAEAGA